MWQRQPHKSSYKESIKTLEADIQHANTLAASLPRDYGGDYVQLKLSYSPFAHFLQFFIEWMDYTCTDTLPSRLGLLHILIYKVYVDGMPTMSSKERKATLREFYGLAFWSIASYWFLTFCLNLFKKLIFFNCKTIAAVIYPSLNLLEGELIELVREDNEQTHCFERDYECRKRVEEKRKLSDKDLERDDECNICMENRTNMVLPNCGHSMCISCFHDWNARSQSCPFCRGSLERVSPGDLWVLTDNIDVVDIVTLAKENIRRFYLFIENLPLIMPDTHLFLYEYLT